MQPHALLVFSDGNSTDRNQILLGLTLHERFRLTAKKAGLTDFYWPDSQQIFPHLPESFIAVSASVLPSVSLLKKMSQIDPEPESIHTAETSAPVFVVRTQHPGLPAQMFRDALPAFSYSKLKPYIIPVSASDYSPLSDGNLRSAEQWLLTGLIKENEGFMSRHVERKISLAVTRRVAATQFTPNQMTFVSALIGIAGALCFLTGNHWHQLTGAVLFWLHSVLDGCDGELARLKFMESRWGGLLDFWTDNLVHIAIFSCLAVGIQRSTGQHYTLILGASAVLGTVLTASLVYFKTMHKKSGPGPVFKGVMDNPALTAPSDRVMDFLARRDFIYLVILLSYFGKAEWFLWMSAIGAPIYLTVLVMMHGKNVKWSNV